MNPKLKHILLIDDNHYDNIYHERIIKDSQVAEKVIFAEDGRAALDILSSVKDGIFPQPELIFLDINMPRMDGWEFLEEYQTLREDQKANVIIVMLSTSLNPSDEERANQFEILNGFENKPLSEEILISLMKKYFGWTDVAP